MFAVLKAAKEIKVRDNAEKMYDMIGVVMTSHGDQKYVDALRQMWRDIRDDAVPEFKTERVRYNDGTPVIPWHQATQIMFQQLAVFKKVNHGR